MFGLSPFEALMAAALLFQVATRAAEWIFKRNADAGDLVKRDEWSIGRLKDMEEARHFTRNELIGYVQQKLYDREQRDVRKRVERLEGMGEQA